MRIDAASPASVAAVAQAMRAADVREFMALAPARDRVELAENLVSQWGHSEHAICASDETGPVSIGAMVPGRRNVVTLLFFATDRFPGIAIDLTRFVTRRLFPRYRERGVHRMECVSIAGHEAAHRWIQLLGLEREAEMPGYGQGGETFLQFAWVSDAVRSPDA